MRSGSQSPFNNALLSGGRSYGLMWLGADQRDRSGVAASCAATRTPTALPTSAPTTTMRSMAMSFAHRPTIAAMSETITLEGWRGPWPDDDKDANLKADIALYSHVDPLRTVRGLSESINVPVGAIVHYVLARWASEGASGLLELGPTMSRRLSRVCTDAEADGSDDGATGRLRATAPDDLVAQLSPRPPRGLRHLSGVALLQSGAVHVGLGLASTRSVTQSTNGTSSTVSV